MPIYEYACGKCGHEFEVEQRITDDPVKTCPSCRSRKVKRLISRTSFVLKGSGWYSDLYSSDGGKGAKGKESGEGASGDAKDKGSGDKSEKKSGDKAGSKSESKAKKGSQAAA